VLKINNIKEYNILILKNISQFVHITIPLRETYEYKRRSLSVHTTSDCIKERET